MTTIQATPLEVWWTLVAALGLGSNLYALHQVLLDRRALGGRNGYRKRIVRWHLVSESIKVAIQALFLLSGLLYLVWPSRPDADELVWVVGHYLPARLAPQLVGGAMMAAGVLLVLHSVLGARYRSSLDRTIRSEMDALSVAGVPVRVGGKRSYDPPAPGAETPS